MSEKLLNLPTLHRGQRFIRKHSKRFTVVAAGRRFGKTALGVDDLVSGTKGVLEGYPVAWAAPTYSLLMTAWRNVEELLDPIITRKNGQEKRIELLGGGSIQFLTLNNPAAGRSLKFSRIVVDEAGHVPQLKDSWEQALRPTLADFEGSALFLSTTNGSNYFTTLHNRGNPTHPDYRKDWQSFKMPTSANPYIPASEIEEARATYPNLVFRQEYEADFVSLSGTLVTTEMLKYKSLLDPKAGVTVLGVDLAISQAATADSCSICVITYIETTGELYVREVLIFKKKFHEILAEISRMAAKWNPALIGIESTQFQAAVTQEMIRTTKLPILAVYPDKSKLLRFMPVFAKYERGLVYHAPGINPVFEAQLLSFPNKSEHDDAVDGLSTAYKTLDSVSNVPLAFSVKGL